MLDTLIAYTVAAMLLTITPGLDTALVIRTATVEGKRQAFSAAAGIGAGCLLWGAAVAFGLGALVAVSELAYNLLKYCGAAYLCWLGFQMLRHPRQQFKTDLPPQTKDSNWFIKGMLGNALNPKVGIFYVSFLPQFIPQGQAIIAWTFGLVGIHVMLGALWAITLIKATQPLSNLLRRPHFLRWMDRATGGLFVTFATLLVFSNQPATAR